MWDFDSQGTVGHRPDDETIFLVHTDFLSAVFVLQPHVLHNQNRNTDRLTEGDRHQKVTQSRKDARLALHISLTTLKQINYINFNALSLVVQSFSYLEKRLPGYPGT